jgi:hypothetical protein
MPWRPCVALRRCDHGLHQSQLACSNSGQFRRCCGEHGDDSIKFAVEQFVVSVRRLGESPQHWPRKKCGSYCDQW